MGLMRSDTPEPLWATPPAAAHIAGTWHQWVPSSCSTPRGRRNRGPRPTCSTRLIPLEAVLLRGIRPLLRHQHDPVVMEHRPRRTLRSWGRKEAMTTQHDRVQTLHPMRHKLRWGWRDSWSTECRRNQTSSNVEK